MSKVIIKDELCKGCKLCVTACPKAIISLTKNSVNSLGFHTAFINDMKKCTGCAFCAKMCPHVAIQVFKQHKEEI